VALSDQDYSELMGALSDIRAALGRIERQLQHGEAATASLTAVLVAGEERRNDLAQRHELRVRGLEDRLALHLELHAHQLAERERGGGV
jgi:hypothetical protein